MNLREQIYRINEMMGIIVEDNKSRLLDIIDREGFYTIMKFVGGPEKIRKIMGRDYIINQIGKDVNRWGNMYRGEYNIDWDIPYKHDEKRGLFHEVTVIGGDYVVIEIYDDDTFNYKEEYNLSYEELPDNVFDEVVKYLSYRQDFFNENSIN
jgi:hypothetical protein